MFDNIYKLTEKLITSFEEISLNDEFVNCIVEFFKKNPDLPPTEENIFKHFSIFESSLTQEVFDKVIQRLQPEAKDKKLVKWSDLLMGQFITVNEYSAKDRISSKFTSI